jgi:hypothetical protein
VPPAATQGDAEKHVTYEIEAMTRGAVRYAQEWDERVNQATPSGYQDAVFFLEASLLHARSLVITFGFPDDKARAVTAALGFSNDEQAFKDALAPLGITAGQSYGQLSELLAHIGRQRWDAPLGIRMHQPVRVAATVLDALEACGAKSSTALAGVIEAEKNRLQPYV